MPAAGYKEVVPPDMWSVFSAPAIAGQASAVKAANLTQRHVCTSISATFSAGATAQAAPAVLNLRDGGAGAGTILWSKQVIMPANGAPWEVNLPGLNIPGTLNLPMTLEFSAAGAAGTLESVAMTGYDAA